MLTKWFYRRRPDEDPSVRGQFTRLARLVRTRPADLDPLREHDRPDAAFESAWRTGVKKRVGVVIVLIGAWVVAIEAQLVNLTVLQHDDLTRRALRQQEQVFKPEALRGDIVDRHGQLLAYSVEADSIGADPTKVKNPEKTAAALCAALGDCTDKDRTELAKRLGGEGRFIYIRRSRDVSPEQVARVEALDLPGVVLSPATRRYYPRYELGAHVIGFVGLENDGQAGVEYVYDKLIRGREGVAFAQVDARKHRLDTHVEREPEPGASLELTLDTYFQFVAERELKAGVLANKAEAGSVVIMDPATGEILALANYPTFNPNAVRQSTDGDRRNRAAQDVYEPGSTFKIVTASAAIEENVLKPTDLIDCNPGSIVFPGRKPITEAKGHNYGLISFEDVIVKSSNIGAIRAGLRVGPERLSRYVHRFGFGQALSPDLMGEGRGIWNPNGLDDSGLASVSMGYQVSVTPLQMALAASVVANGGLLMEPHIVRAVVRDGVREPVAPKVLRRAISQETAQTLTEIMEAVTVRGTATAARMDEYEVAGKTGTAQKLVDGHYSATDHNASFVGFVPATRPAYTILVVIDTPRAGTYYGGSVAAPIFKKIAAGLLQHEGVPRTINPQPPVMIAGGPPTLPAPPLRPTTVIPALAPIGGRALMPDVRGLSAREALRVLSDAGLSVRLKGSGFVNSQSPAPGEAIDPGAWSVIELGRTWSEPRPAPGGGE